MLAECRARARGVDGRDGIEIAINLAALKTNNKASLLWQHIQQTNDEAQLFRCFVFVPSFLKEGRKEEGREVGVEGGRGVEAQRL